MDKAGQKFWNDSWAGSAVTPAVDPTDTRLANWVNRRFHRLFLRLFDKSQASGMRLLEIGCAKSAWLPYFAKEFGFRVCGIDYSPIGARMARDVLQVNGVDAEIVCADLFSPPQQMLGAFDVVVSFGVAEHFEDTTAYLIAASQFLKPGGTLVTSIPNMVGWIDALQKAINKPVYDIHELLDPAVLMEAHALAGLDVLQCDYFLFTSFGVSSLTGVSMSTASSFLKKVCVAILGRVSMLA